MTDSSQFVSLMALAGQAATHLEQAMQRPQSNMGISKGSSW
jgi:hypothetical protein